MNVSGNSTQFTIFLNIHKYKWKNILFFHTITQVLLLWKLHWFPSLQLPITLVQHCQVSRSCFERFMNTIRYDTLSFCFYYKGKIVLVSGKTPIEPTWREIQARGAVAGITSARVCKNLINLSLFHIAFLICFFSLIDRYWVVVNVCGLCSDPSGTHWVLVWWNRFKRYHHSNGGTFLSELDRCKCYTLGSCKHWQHHWSSFCECDNWWME